RPPSQPRPEFFWKSEATPSAENDGLPTPSSAATGIHVGAEYFNFGLNRSVRGIGAGFRQMECGRVRSRRHVPFPSACAPLRTPPHAIARHRLRSCRGFASHRDPARPIQLGPESPAVRLPGNLRFGRISPVPLKTITYLDSLL